ncbi:unnamed protein product [Gongylonema pulchrum]|uniref:Uncharacterized protein n=1 Tax=Gongylonema pulchrum TaxID=637853 RepID=A0A183DLL8_9BILA|nr:unnamed protein product [Gongylonema pulchrum]
MVLLQDFREWYYTTELLLLLVLLLFLSILMARTFCTKTAKCIGAVKYHDTTGAITSATTAGAIGTAAEPAAATVVLLKSPTDKDIESLQPSFTELLFDIDIFVSFL